LLELIFNVEVIVSHLGLLGGVLVEQIIQLVHFEVKVLESNFEGADFFFMTLHLVVKSELFLLQYGLLCAERVTLVGQVRQCVLLLNQLGLVSDPLLLHLCDLILLLIDLLLDIVLLGFKWPRILILAILLL